MTHNRARRQKYAESPAYADRARAASREYYRRTNPLAESKLASGLLLEGQLREVIAEDMDHPEPVESFTIPKAAKALGRSELTFKRWISEEMVPPPVLQDASRGYRLYSVGELQVIAHVLAQHEQEFAYLTSKHTQTIEALHQWMQGFRATQI